MGRKQGHTTHMKLLIKTFMIVTKYNSVYISKGIYVSDLSYQILLDIKKSRNCGTCIFNDNNDINMSCDKYIIDKKSDFIISLFGDDGYKLIAYNLIHEVLNRCCIDNQNILYLSSYFSGIEDGDNIHIFYESLKKCCEINNIKMDKFTYRYYDRIYPIIDIDIISNGENTKTSNLTEMVIILLRLIISEYLYDLFGLVQFLIDTNNVDLQVIQKYAHVINPTINK